MCRVATLLPDTKLVEVCEKHLQGFEGTFDVTCVLTVDNVAVVSTHPQNRFDDVAHRNVVEHLCPLQRVVWRKSTDKMMEEN